MNSVLLDTHIFFWWLENSKKLKQSIIDIIDDTHFVYVSSISAYELYSKKNIEKISFDFDILKEVTLFGFLTLDYSHLHAACIQNLPLHHRDPFDRMLITQSLCEDIPLITADEQIHKYEEIITIKA